ncbi:MAG: hypothetical protein R3B51_05275 [Thermodesulfobacteriota bacterium]
MQNGAKLRLKGKGVTNLKTKARGDQYIEIKLVMPDKISEEEKAKFEELEKARPYNPDEIRKIYEVKGSGAHPPRPENTR